MADKPVIGREEYEQFSVSAQTRVAETLLALELVYMDGCADQLSGDVEAPTGHFYRVGRQIVVTNSQGFKDVEDFTTEAEAIAEFDRLDNLYSKWERDEIL